MRKTFVLFAGQNGNLITSASAYLERAEDEGILVKDSTLREYHLRDLKKVFEDKLSIEKLEKLVREGDFNPGTMAVLRAELNPSHEGNSESVNKFITNFLDRYSNVLHVIYSPL